MCNLPVLNGTVREMIKIRPIETCEEYRAAERLQHVAWGQEDLDVVPDHLMITMQKNGGPVLGAFQALPEEEPGEKPEEKNEQLIGFALGFAGLTPDGRLKHCSHMVGVAPGHQNRNVGYRLKLAQRELVAAQGIDLITWTFDPLESRNARLNFHKLGATCNTYLRDIYGQMRDELNVGLPSDRFQVDWHIATDHVADRLRSDRADISFSALQAEGIPILNHALPPSRYEGKQRGTFRHKGKQRGTFHYKGKQRAGDLPHPPDEILPLEGDRVLIEIPAHFQAIKSTDVGLARAWRLHTRELFETAFTAGYVVVDLVVVGGSHLHFEERRSYYLLKTDWTPR